MELKLQNKCTSIYAFIYKGDNSFLEVPSFRKNIDRSKNIAKNLIFKMGKISQFKQF